MAGLTTDCLRIWLGIMASPAMAIAARQTIFTDEVAMQNPVREALAELVRLRAEMVTRLTWGNSWEKAWADADAALALPAPEPVLYASSNLVESAGQGIECSGHAQSSPDALFDAPLYAEPPAPTRQMIERAKDDHGMHEFYCGMLRALLHAAECYRTVFRATVTNRVSQDAADTLNERIAETTAFLADGEPPAPREPIGSALTFDAVSVINLERALVWHPGGLEEWSEADWSNAMAGEAGEVCNAVKKLRRIQFGIQQAKGPHTVEEAKADIANEIGDTFLYLDLLAQRIGVNIADAIAETFNRVSVREGFPQMLPHRDNAAPSEIARDAARVTRLEVIDHRKNAHPDGRFLCLWDVAVQLSYQDDGRTLKVFVTDAAIEQERNA